MDDLNTDDLNTDDLNRTTGNATAECHALINLPTFMHFALIPAVAIIAVFAVLHRKNVKCGRLSWRPGMVVPVDFLDGYKNRWAYAAAFGAMSNRLLALLVNSEQYWGEDVVAPMWVKRTFLLLFAMLETSLVFYPILACLTSPYRLVGGILGGCYSFTWFIVQLIYLFDCPHTDFPVFFLTVDWSYSKLLLQWPSAAFFLIIVGNFIYLVWISLKTRVFVLKDKRRLASPQHFDYVRCLFSGKLPKRIINSFDEGFLDTFKYQSIQSFLYPSVILCVLFAGISLSYQILIAVFYALGNVSKLVDDAARKIAPQELVGLVRLQFDAVIIVTVCGWITIVLVLLVMLGTSFLVLKNYRRNILQLCRGDKSFLSPVDLSSTTLMATSMRWAAYQIAYLVWGLLIFYWAVLIILLAVVLTVYYVIYSFGWDGIAALLVWIVPPLVMGIIIFYSQRAWARYFFLQPRPGPDQPVPLAIDNRKSFETAYYITFFITIAIGSFSSIIRLLMSLVIGLLTLGRMDQPIVKRGYERFDKGHRAYVGQLFVDYTHNHPVLRVFCDELLALTDNLKFQIPLERYRMVSSKQGDTGRRARRRWQVAYTLVRNPDLIARRKRNMFFSVDLSAGDCGAVAQSMAQNQV